MDSFDFGLSPEAARSFSQLVLAIGSLDDFVLTIAPMTEAREVDLVEGSLAKTVASTLEKVHADIVQGTFRTMKLQWVVGASRRARFPPEDIFVCDGVPCFIPKEMRPVLDGRTLTLVDNELRIEPEPPPPTV